MTRWKIGGFGQAGVCEVTGAAIPRRGAGEHLQEPETRAKRLTAGSIHWAGYERLVRRAQRRPEKRIKLRNVEWNLLVCVLGAWLAITTAAPAATFVWSGGGANADWSNGSNWVGGIAPTGPAATRDDLVFPSSAPAASCVSTNDLAGATFNSLAFSASG